MGVTISRAAIAFAIAGALGSFSARARADDSPLASIAAPWTLPPNVLTAVHGGGVGPVGAIPSGAFVGVDTGYAALFSTPHHEAEGAWAFGGRLGYQFRSGLAVQARADDLGVTIPGASTPLIATGIGARYSVPITAMPFAEALVGPTFAGSTTSVDVALGLGLSVPILRHLLIDASARDWITDFDSTVRHTATFELGLSIGFGRGS